MTKDEFIAERRESLGNEGYELWSRGRIVLPCACGEPGCRGWSMVRDEPEDIEMHNRMYGPVGDAS